MPFATNFNGEMADEARVLDKSSIVKISTKKLSTACRYLDSTIYLGNSGNVRYFFMMYARRYSTFRRGAREQLRRVLFLVFTVDLLLVQYGPFQQK